MPKTFARVGALLVLTLALSGCEAGGPAVAPSSSPPSATAPSTSPSGAGRLPASESGAAAPGLEIRYLDEDGNPQVLQPKDFPRR
jgi:hypothetical protein